jgi:hypothetical protein
MEMNGKWVLPKSVFYLSDNVCLNDKMEMPIWWRFPKCELKFGLAETDKLASVCVIKKNWLESGWPEGFFEKKIVKI